MPVLYTLSALNGAFLLYLLVKRPYESKLDNLGAILSNSITFFYLTVNLISNINQSA